MKLAESINELSTKDIVETWYNSQIIHNEMKDFLESSIYSVYDDNGYEKISSYISAHNFISGGMSISIWAKFINEDLWDENFELLSLGIWESDDEDSLYFYTSLDFMDKFNSDYFEKNIQANKIKKDLITKGWDFDYDEENEYWNAIKRKPIEDIDFTKPSWKKDLKRFFEDCLTELSDTIFVTKNWLV